MLWAFYFLGGVSVISTFMVIVQRKPVYALIYFILSLLSISGIFFVLGAFFSAALEVIIYSGAIMLLFLFVIMMLNFRITLKYRKLTWIQSNLRMVFYLFPIILLFFFKNIIFSLGNKDILITVHDVREVGINLFGPYLFVVELSSMLLLAAVIIVYCLARKLTGTK
ncbi:NADH-quinone oxidoreductase subunit J [Buchnera aphidicola (Hormaphis cornu)]|nr:NADH-quinone oxidoreductase subunit J [Buchnera aphidicola (Hormaphis cornu)]